MKKLISLLLVVCMLAACCTAFAAESSTEQKADALYLLGLFKGTDQGYELDENTTREQGVVMILRVMGVEDEALSENASCHFDDVYDWAKPYIGYAYKNGITKGMSDTKFGYGVQITDAMFLTMLLRVLGYTEGEGKDFVWNDPYDVGRSAGLIDYRLADQEFIRGDMVEIIYNLLKAKYKDAQTTVAEQLIKDGVFSQTVYAQAQKVADGSMTLEEAQKPQDNNRNDGFGVIPDPAPGIGGGSSDTNESQQGNHELPDMDI